MNPLPFILGLPRWAKLAGVAALALAAFLIWNHFDNKAAIENDRNKANAEANKTLREADTVAHEAGNEVMDTVEAEHEHADEAADGSDDPLGDWLRGL